MTEAPRSYPDTTDAAFRWSCPQCNYSVTPNEIFSERKHFDAHALECVRCLYRTETKPTWEEAKAAYCRAPAQAVQVPSREQLIRTICGHALCDLQHAQAAADAILSSLPSTPDQASPKTHQIALADEIERLRDVLGKIKNLGSGIECRNAARDALCSDFTQSVGQTKLDTLTGTIATVYGELDPEDCAMVDREWARMRGYILPTNGSGQIKDSESEEVERMRVGLEAIANSDSSYGAPDLRRRAKAALALSSTDREGK